MNNKELDPQCDSIKTMRSPLKAKIGFGEQRKN